MHSADQAYSVLLPFAWQPIVQMSLQKLPRRCHYELRATKSGRSFKLLAYCQKIHVASLNWTGDLAFELVCAFIIQTERAENLLLDGNTLRFLQPLESQQLLDVLTEYQLPATVASPESILGSAIRCLVGAEVVGTVDTNRVLVDTLKQLLEQYHA